MHDIDLMLQLQLEGRHAEARSISDKIENAGPEKLLDPSGQATQEIWMRHCFNRGWFLIQDGQYQKGCQTLECGRYLSVYGSPPLHTNAPIYNPEVHNIVGKSIIVSLEGGYGDEIIHARFATSFKKLGAEKVYIAASPELVSLFERIDGVDKVILRNQAHTVSHDYWVPGFSAGWVSGHTFEDFPSKPYISAKPESMEVWKSVLSSEKKKIGIRWAGNPKFEHQQFRKFPESFITNISKYSDLELYSFQRDHNIIQLPPGIHDLQHFLISWEDTAAALMNLDLLITSCTSVAHLAASMGVKTWVIVPCLPYHTWAWKAPESTTSPYYDSVRVFRQTVHGKWNDVFQKVYQALEEEYGLDHVDMPNEDKVAKKLNLGCGTNQIQGYHNVDISHYVNPDEVVDLNTTPWPWKDNEYSHIVAKDVLEHLGKNGDDFINIIKEMYRVSDNGAIWEVQVPHWRCDTLLDDPTHVRAITPGTFKLFNKKLQIDKMRKKEADSPLAFNHDVDIELCDIQFQYTKPFADKIKLGQITQEELNHCLNHMNNVAVSVIYLIQVHKPGRIDDSEFENELGLASTNRVQIGRPLDSNA